MMIKHTDIQPKAIKRRGQVVGQRVDTTCTYHANVEPGVSIRIFGSRFGKPFDQTFKVGDCATYDSYNLVYIGKIDSIGQKTVTIAENYSDARKHRLDFYEFCWRNYNFDLERISAENHQTSLSI